MLADIACDRSKDPRFALMFSCMGRGPYFYGGVDRDLELVRQRFPGMPLLGAYCAGEMQAIRVAPQQCLHTYLYFGAQPPAPSGSMSRMCQTEQKSSSGWKPASDSRSRRLPSRRKMEMPGIHPPLSER